MIKIVFYIVGNPLANFTLFKEVEVFTFFFSFLGFQHRFLLFMKLYLLFALFQWYFKLIPRWYTINFTWLSFEVLEIIQTFSFRQSLGARRCHWNINAERAQSTLFFSYLLLSKNLRIKFCFVLCKHLINKECWGIMTKWNYHEII